MEHLGEFIINHWQLCLGAFIILILIVIVELQNKNHGGAALSPAEAVDLLNNDGVIIDLRPYETFCQGHIINAINVPLSENLVNVLKKHKNKRVMVVCGRGLQAPQILKKLKQQGFNDLFALKGGMLAWEEAQLPVVKFKKT